MGKAAGTLDEVSLAGDAELIGLSREGDMAAFEVLWRRHVAAAATYARLACGVKDPDDVVQEAYARILRLLRDGRGPEDNFRAYLLSTVRNVVINDQSSARSRLVTETTPGDDAAVADVAWWSPSAEDDYVGRELAEDITRVFYAMNERYRKVLWLSEVEGCRVAEVAAIMNTTAATVSVALNRAKKQFRELWVKAATADGVAVPALPVVVDPGVAPEVVEAPAAVGAKVKRTPHPSRTGRRLVESVVGVNAAGYAAAAIEAAAVAAPPAFPLAVAGGAVAAGAGVGIAIKVLTGVIVTVVVATGGVVAANRLGPRQPLPPGASPSSTVSEAPLASIAITDVDTAEGLCYPVVGGTALAGSTIRVGLGDDSAETVSVGSDGRWRVGPLAGWAAGTKTVSAWDASGAQLTATASVHVDAPPAIGLSQTSGGLIVTVHGQSGRSVVVTLDGAALGTVVLDGSGTARQTYHPRLIAGQHRIAVAYQGAGCTGPAVALEFRR